VNALFFDRDDTLNLCNLKGLYYVTKPEQLELAPGVAEALRNLGGAGYTLYCVTNQHCIREEIITWADLGRINQKLNELTGFEIAEIAVCYGEKGPEKAKAKAALILAICARERWLPSESWMVGDQESDIEAGKMAGCKTIHLWYPDSYIHGDSETKKAALALRGEKPETDADFEASSMEEVTEIILGAQP
jgi:D-glycero-D-manno-heptose 1,7-bisphosphate phosphatase